MTPTVELHGHVTPGFVARRALDSALDLGPRTAACDATRLGVRRGPKVDVESRTFGLDRNELGGLLVQAELGSARDHALISFLALNGLRISEALGADIESTRSRRLGVSKIMGSTTCVSTSVAEAA